MRPTNILDWITIILTIIGGINWGLIGLLEVDLVALIFGEFTIITRIIYTVVGIAAVYILVRILMPTNAAADLRDHVS